MNEELRKRIQKLKDEDAEKERERVAPGTCVVCGGNAPPVMQQEASRRGIVIGGPPPRYFISGYACSDCGLCYNKKPTGKSRQKPTE